MARDATCIQLPAMGDMFMTDILNASRPHPSRLLQSVALAPHGIRVNAVGPGSIDTAMMAGVNANPEALVAAMSRTPPKRPKPAREVGDVVAFLASSRVGCITGETIDVKGGRFGLNYAC